MQPGQTISPGQPQEEPTWQYHSEQPSPQPETSGPEHTQSTPPASASQPAAAQPQPAPTANDSSAITWTAYEFIAHAKSVGWYLVLALGTVGAAAATYFMTKENLPTAVIGIVGIIFGIAAARKPRELQYKVDDHGIQIAEKSYPYHSFRSFSLVVEGGIESIWFMPLKRFMPIISIYFDPKDGDRIADTLSRALPLENRMPDPVDRLMHRIRF